LTVAELIEQSQELVPGFLNKNVFILLEKVCCHWINWDSRFRDITMDKSKKKDQ